MVRRFEFIEWNKARFWEIEHDYDVVITRQGSIGGRAPKEREKRFLDEAEAEVHFDKQIHLKRRQGWKEVSEPSEALEDFEERALEMRPLDGSEPVVFSGPAMAYLLWRMVEVQMFDRHRVPDDLSRWHGRAARSLGLDGNPSPDHPRYDEWVERYREASTRDRAAPMKDDVVGAFKFREGTHWIVTPEECAYIATEGANRMPKRKKTKADQQEWLDAWTAFHERMKDIGYEVVPVR